MCQCFGIIAVVKSLFLTLQLGSMYSSASAYSDGVLRMLSSGMPCQHCDAVRWMDLYGLVLGAGSIQVTSSKISSASKGSVSDCADEEIFEARGLGSTVDLRVSH